MASYYKVGNRFRVVYRLKGQPRRYVNGIKSERLAIQVKHQKELQEQLTRAQLLQVDPSAEKVASAERKPIAEHIAAFENLLLARGRDPQHAHQQASHVRRLLRMAAIGSVRSIAAEPVQKSLKQLHSSGRGPRTCNAARQAIMQFENFLFRTGKVRGTVLHDLTRFNEKEDIRRKRRAMSQEEVDWLLTITAGRHDRFARRFGIVPADRAMLYAVGLATGFRQSALLSLSKASFFVKEGVDAPFVRLAPRFNKNRKDRNQLIPQAVAAQLRYWLKKQPDQGPVWRVATNADPALRFRRDMEAARDAWIAAAVDVAERKRRESSNTLKYVHHDGTRNVWADFHGLRHTGITFVVRAGDIWAGQAWADHSTPLLTAGYAHVEASDLKKAVGGVPNVQAALPKKKALNIAVPTVENTPAGDERSVQRRLQRAVQTSRDQMKQFGTGCRGETKGRKKAG